MIRENTDIKGIYKQIRTLETRYRKNIESHLFFPLADAYTKVDMLDQAEVILREGLSNHPKYCAARALLGEVLFKKGDFEDAQQQLEEVVEMVPDNIMAHKLLVEVYRRIGLRDRYERELKALKMIDQKGFYSGMGLNETTITESHIEATKLKKDKGGIGAFESESRGGLSKDENMVDFIEKNKLEVMRKMETDREKDFTMDEVGDIQFGFCQKSKDEEDSVLTGVFHGEGDGEIVTATLAELYFSQGILEKSIEIYEKLLKQHPGKEEWVKRLSEIQEFQKNIRIDSEVIDDRVEHSGEDGKKENTLSILEKWLENCQRLRKSNVL